MLSELSEARWGPHAGSSSVRALSTMLAADRLPHALLLAGPIGVGKRDLALRVAQALICESRASARSGADGPCRACRTCQRLHQPSQPELAPQHADIELVAPGSLCAESDHDHRNARSIGICVVRRIEQAIALTPFEAERRVIIIDPADALTSEAADAFLKTLEEPPDRVHFVLLSAREAELSETIRSRCRSLPLTPLPAAQLDRWLGDWAAEAGVSLPHDEERRAELIRLARGRPGWLQTALRSGDPVTQRAAQIDEAERLAGAARGERLQWSERTVGRGMTAQTLADLDQLLDAWSDWWRDLWLSQQLGQSDSCEESAADLTHPSQQERIERLAGLYDQRDISQFLEQIERARAHIQNGVNARLALDVLLLRIPPAQAAPGQPHE